jgi:osmotically-inducible protein OsmY
MWKKPVRIISVLVLISVVLAGCKAMTGKTLGRTIDDAGITASVKTQLAKQRASSLARIDVDTNEGVVYLNGTVESGDVKAKAAQVAQQIDGVVRVVNNLQVQK